MSLISQDPRAALDAVTPIGNDAPTFWRNLVAGVNDPPSGSERAVWIGVAEDIPAHGKCVRKHPRIAARFGGVDEAVGGYHRLVSRTGDE